MKMGGWEFSPVFPNLPDVSQSIITVLNQAKPGALYLNKPPHADVCRHSSPLPPPRSIRKEWVTNP